MEADSLKWLGLIWRGWLRFAIIFGNVQMIVVLTLVYFVMVALVAIPFKLLADPLSLRRRHPAWTPRAADEDLSESMRRQG
jgi:hypothetical protein